jgi:hypothetical protein
MRLVRFSLAALGWLILLGSERPARGEVPFGVTSASSAERGAKGRKVLTVRPASIADLADLQVGDIVLAINGYPVEKDDDEDGIVGMMPGGAALQIVVFRAGKRLILMGKMPPALAVVKPPPEAPPPAPDPKPRVEPEPPPQASRVEAPPSEPGPLLVRLPPGALDAGIDDPPAPQEEQALPAAVTQVAPPPRPPPPTPPPPPPGPKVPEVLPEGVMSVDDVSVGR